VEVLGGRGDQLDITVKVQSRLRKTSEPPVVALGDAVNITTDMVDASELAWLTGKP